MGTLWFAHPAKKWEEGLPIGNGRLGAMILGGQNRERIALNQDSIWYGGPADRVNPDARAHFKQVRQLLLDGRIPEAEDLLRLSFSGTPQSQRPYQPLGDLTLSYRMPSEGGAQIPKESGTEEGYRRTLDLEKGIVTEQYRMAGKWVKKEYLASYPHGVMAVRIRVPEGTICLEAMLSRKRFYGRAGRLGENAIYMDGTLGDGGVSWMAAVCARVHGGTVRVLGEQIVIRDAKPPFMKKIIKVSWKRDCRQPFGTVLRPCVKSIWKITGRCTGVFLCGLERTQGTYRWRNGLPGAEGKDLTAILLPFTFSTAGIC